MKLQAIPPKLRFVDNNGIALAGGKVYTYDGGTTTPKATYTDYDGATPNANPVILDSRGEAGIWLSEGLYKFVVKDSAETTIYTVDDISNEPSLTPANLAAVGGSLLIGHKGAGTNMVATTVDAKLIENIDLAADYGVTGTGNESTKVQQAIDDLPSTGGVINWPGSSVTCHNIKLEGTDGTKTNVIIRGKGQASKAVAPASSDKNVFEGIGTSGCGIEDMEVIGSSGNGGAETPGPNRGFAANGMVVALNDRVEVSSADAYTTTVAATNRVYQCTTGVTLGATFAASLGNFTLTAEANFNTSDLSYRYGHAIYFDDSSECYAKNVTARDCVYTAFNFGTGPVQAANAGPGTDRCRIIDCASYDCDNAVSGGKIRDIMIDGLLIKDNRNYGAVIDADGGDAQIIGVNAQSCGNHAIYIYNASTVIIDDYTISDCLNGVIVENGATLVSVGQGTIKNCTNVPVLVRNAPLVTINGLVAHNNTGSIEVTSTYACSMVGVIASSATGTGKSNIKITDSSIVSIGAGTISTLANLHGIELDGCDQVTIGDGTFCFNNNVSNDSDGSGLYALDTTNVTVSGFSAFDTRSGGSKTQEYGIKTAGTSESWIIGANRLGGNATGTYVLVGSANRVQPDFADYTNAATPASFTADKLLTFVDSDGTIIYIPARLGSW